MCLTTLNKPEKAEGFGWKVFSKHNGKLYSTFCKSFEEYKKPRVVGEWLKADKVEMGNGVKYLSGWHIFKNEDDAILVGHFSTGVIKRVEYREARHEGTVMWWGTYSLTDCIVADCIVADEMKILDE